MKIIKNSGKLSFRELQIITISNLMLSKLLKKWTEGFKKEIVQYNRC
jgi:hypothetical protein